MSIRTRLKRLEDSRAIGLQVFLLEPHFETVDEDLRLCSVTVWNKTAKLEIECRADEAIEQLWDRAKQTVMEKTGARRAILLASHVAAL